VNSLKPNLAHILGNVSYARVLQEIGLGSDESKVHDDRKGRDLPSFVGDKGTKERFGLCRRVGIKKFATPGTFAGQGHCRGLIAWIGRETCTAKLIFLRRTGKQDAGEMFNACLAGLRGLQRGDAIGNVPNKTNVVAFTSVGDGEISFAA
jgi:hypothetical protein